MKKTASLCHFRNLAGLFGQLSMFAGGGDPDLRFIGGIGKSLRVCFI